MLHRIRAMQGGDPLFNGPVEADETFIGGKEANKHKGKKLHTRGTVGKAAVVGMKDRETNQITAMPVESVDRSTLQGFVYQHTSADTIVYTDEAAAYVGLRRPHKAVNHSAKEFVDGMAHTNGMECSGQCQARIPRLSPVRAKHLHRYVRVRGQAQRAPDGHGGADGGDSPRDVRERLRYADLIGPEYTRLNTQLGLA